VLRHGIGVLRRGRELLRQSRVDSDGEVGIVLRHGIGVLCGRRELLRESRVDSDGEVGLVLRHGIGVLCRRRELLREGRVVARVRAGECRNPTGPLGMSPADPSCFGPKKAMRKLAAQSCRLLVALPTRPHARHFNSGYWSFSSGYYSHAKCPRFCIGGLARNRNTRDEAAR